MPFTASHPALILPLLGTGLPASALVIGSMTPDLPLYLPFGVSWPTTHAPAALPTVDLALGFALWAAWHGLLAPAAVVGAPAALRCRIAPSATTGLAARLRRRELVAVAVALVAGSASHLLWDAFTHPDSWGTQHVAVLASPWHGRDGYLWAQYASDVVGALVLAVWVERWWRRTPPATQQADAAPATAVAVVSWLTVAGSAAGAGLLAAAAVGRPVRDAAVAGAKSGGTAGLLVAVALSAAVAFRRNRPPTCR